MSRTKTILLAAVLMAAGAGAYFWQAGNSGAEQQKYRTEPVSRGTIAQTVAANGTLNPVVLVNVGTQVSGTVKTLRADFNARVKAGQILAELDPALLEAQLRQNQANLANAEAALKLAQIKADRQRTLFEKSFVSQSALDEAVESLEGARAQVAAAHAQVARDQTNLRYTVIRSPISGVVVARNVDIGQTVAASFQTPVLFQIAKDLREMQIDTSVAEADIGGIKIGLPVRFTVDTFPDRPFEGKVKQVRLNPTIQQNVVTYNVVIAVDNADEKLMPGMTAHVQISTGRREQALRVPNAALRYRPSATENGKPGKPKAKDGTTVYRLKDGKPEPVAIQTGITDGSHTEVTGGELGADDAVIVKETGKKDKGGNFKPRLF